MAENGKEENSSEGASQNPTTQPKQQDQQKPSTREQQSQSEEVTVPEEQLVNDQDSRGDPEDPFHDGGSELSSPPPEDSLSSGGEGTLTEDGVPAVLVPPNTGMYVLSPAPPPHMLPMVTLANDGMSSEGGPSSPPPVHEDDLRKVLLQQIEYYFSKDNLTSDKYLISQMDGDHFVPISVVAAFNQVKKLNVDSDLIVEAIKDSTMLQLSEDNDKVRAIPEKRCVLILREIPKETPKESITALFKGKKCPNYVTCEFADNDCWYVTFDTEEETQQAHAFLREEVREFLGQPIRARIKCTTVQRSSGIPKKRNPSYPPVPSVYNGGPQLPYYQQPNMMPWSPNAPYYADFEPNFDPNYELGNYTQYLGNGFPPHQAQQQNPQQQQQRYTGPQNRFPPPSVYPAGRGIEGERGGGRGRGGANEWQHSRVDRGNSPPMANGDVPSERGRRGGGDHYSGGGGAGGRYRRDNDERKQVPPRLNRNNRHMRNSDGGEKGDRPKRSQVPPRQQQQQQNKQQPKLDLAPANFPPLPTSESGLTPSQPPTLTTSHNLTSHEEGKTVADIVKGSRPKDITAVTSSSSQPMAPQSQPPPSTSTTNSGWGTVPLSQILNNKSSSNQTGTPQTVNHQGPTPNATTNSTTSSSSSTSSQQQVNNVSTTTAKVTVSRTVGTKSQTVSQANSGVVATSNVTQTLVSAVVSGGISASSAVTAQQNSSSQRQQNSVKDPVREVKPPVNKGGSRFSEKDNGFVNRQHNGRNSQVHSKSDGRSSAPINNRGRFRDRGDKDNRRQGGMGVRSQQQRPSPKAPKKQSAAPQAPPPPPTPTSPPADTKTTPNSANGDTTTGANKSEKLSYAQMAQKAPPPPPAPSKTNPTPQGNGTSTPSSGTTTQTTPVTTSSNQSQQVPSKTVSAPTSPQQTTSSQQLQLTSSQPNGTVNQSNNSTVSSVKPSANSESKTSSHPVLTASKSAPPSPSKEGGVKGE